MHRQNECKGTVVYVRSLITVLFAMFYLKAV